MLVTARSGPEIIASTAGNLNSTPDWLAWVMLWLDCLQLPVSHSDVNSNFPHPLPPFSALHFEFVLKILVYLLRLCTSLEILENTVPLTT